MPFGSMRHGYTFQAAAGGAPAGSWADWASTDVGSINVNSSPDRRDYRYSDVVTLNSNYYQTGFVYNNNTAYGDKFTTSGSTLTYDSDSTWNASEYAYVNRSLSFTLPDHDKAIVYYFHSSTTWHMAVLNESGGVINELNEVTVTASNVTSISIWNDVLIDPNDSSKFCLIDRNGNTAWFSFNNATNAITLVADRSQSQLNATTNTAQSWMVDNAGTAQSCTVYVDATTNEWKIYQADMDGSNGTTYTLGDNDTLGFGIGSWMQNKHYHTQNTMIQFSGNATSTMKAWWATWNGSSWTQSSSETSFATSSFTSNSTFQNVFRRSAGITAPNDVYFAYFNLMSTASAMIGVVGCFEVVGGAVTLIDKVQVTNTGDVNTLANSNPDDQGFTWSNDYSTLVVLGDDIIDGQYSSMSVLTRPT